MRTETKWRFKQFPTYFCRTLFCLILASSSICGQSAYRQNFNSGWKFYKYTSGPDKLMYDERPEVQEHKDDIDADSRPTEAVMMNTTEKVLKKWILPTANPFIKDKNFHHIRPAGHPGSDFAFVQSHFDDNSWETLDLPHDWAINGPFFEGWNTIIGGGMGRLPIQGVGWYRKKLFISEKDKNKQIYLDIDGAMSYAIVWLNGNLVGGWPYGYNSFRLDLTPYILAGKENQLAIRIDNPAHSSRWYPGAGIYRNVWLTKTNPVHVGQWGTSIRTKDISKNSTTIDLDLTVSNKTLSAQTLRAETVIYPIDSQGKKANKPAGTFPTTKISIKANSNETSKITTKLNNPSLWGPPPTQKPNMYVAVTKLFNGQNLVDEYETRFGIRKVEFHPTKGVIVNGEALRIQGVNQHHDLGALGAAFNIQAARRQLDMLKELGVNAIRLAHNPPAPELLELTDSMGFLVINEIYDNWETKKTPLDFHLIFQDWQEADLRAFLRRDRNNPSVIAWSYGNEVGEQYTDVKGAELSGKLKNIVSEEDPTRPATASMNYAKPHMPFAEVQDIISLNYQGEGIRNAPEYAHLKGINTPPLYPAFHEKFPDKLIFSSESAAAVSSRGTYVFPVTAGISSPAESDKGGDDKNNYVSAYELYTAPFGSSADKVFLSQDKHPYVAGEFVWSGWDYLGEPTPYYLARSSYFGIIDLAGFKKDRFYLYQSRWRPKLPMVHILPHWNWPDRIGQITPIHVFTSGDEAELFLNGKSLGKKKKTEYRLRWDDVKYEPGEVKVVAYKNGKKWAEETIKTTLAAHKIELIPGAVKTTKDGLIFVTARVVDKNGITVPDASNLISFSIEGPAKIQATDNGDPTNLISFASKQRTAFGGLLLAIIRADKGTAGKIKLTAKSEGLISSNIEITSN